ncbi:hydroxymethylbilane synthase [Armatimonas rosea]|uniref:Porphobilinogen deaminase n=1 Tax=Armatimonas rosea TaxID=685828 RepID=A0A7W9SPW7_ARMRO|nr:hydroxymethylbilane synthase [Armatimonas rosea]MBB6050667.1 hydroxymethylbilane synthase [Armatimonas rosea]
MRLRFGTRGSKLARWQTDHVLSLLPEGSGEIEVIQTKGDRVLDTPLPLIGGKGLFTAELEAALHENRIQCAVHSLKDLPTEQPTGLAIGAILKRAPVGDVLVSRSGKSLLDLPHHATIGTSSRRRAAQLLRARPDLQLLDIRGNVDTRIQKALDPSGPYDAILLAHAGLERLGYSATITEVLPFNVLLPAPGQGAIAVQCRDDAAIIAALAPLHDTATAQAVTAERSFLAALGGGCSLPLAAYAYLEGSTLTLTARVLSLDGTRCIEVTGTASPSDAEALGAQLADDAKAQGATELLG